MQLLQVSQNKLPARCVLNGLETVPIPPELSKLDALSSHSVLNATRLLSGSVLTLPRYRYTISLKACKGTMFFLPLPLNEMLDQVERHVNGTLSLPDPELYIIVNGKPTISKVCGVVWSM